MLEIIENNKAPITKEELDRLKKESFIEYSKKRKEWLEWIKSQRQSSRRMYKNESARDQRELFKERLEKQGKTLAQYLKEKANRRCVDCDKLIGRTSTRCIQCSQKNRRKKYATEKENIQADKRRAYMRDYIAARRFIKTLIQKESNHGGGTMEQEQREVDEHIVQIDDYLEVKLRIPKVMRPDELEGLMNKSRKLLSMSNVQISEKTLPSERISTVPKQISKPWTEQDKQRVKEMVVSGKKVKEIAKEMNRSIMSIYMIKQRLGV